MNKEVKEKTHRVFVPLTSFYLYDMSPVQKEETPAKVIHSWDIPNTDIKLVQFSKRIGVSKNYKNPFFTEDIIFDGKSFATSTMFPDRHDNLSFNSGLMFSFIQKDSGQIVIFPHAFENNIRNTITFLRLFCPGNLFAPYGFIEKTDIVYFPDFQQNLNDGSSALYINNVDKFLKFYEKYSTLTENLRQVALANPKSVFESWYKRINNGIYFLNQTYFTSERNQMNPDAKDKNNLRLIYLCTALDALIGSGNPSGKDLAQKANLILCNIIGAIKKDVENFYDERSRYIHANPNTMSGATTNKTIEKFSLYIQKIILVSLDLSGNADFIQALKASSQKHWFSFYEKPTLYKQYLIKKITRGAFEAVSKNKDGYGLADSNFIESKIKIWSQEPF